MLDDPLVFWLLPASWAVHDVEEYVALPAWHARNEASLRRLARRSSLARRVIASLPTARGTFVIAATLVGLLLLGAAGAATVDPHGIGVVVFSVCLGGYALHGVVHLAQALCFRGYVPGVVTTLAVVFPTSAFLYRWLLGTGRVDFQVVVATAAAGLVLFAPVIVVAGHVAHLLDGRRRSG